MDGSLSPKFSWRIFHSLGGKGRRGQAIPRMGRHHLTAFSGSRLNQERSTSNNRNSDGPNENFWRGVMTQICTMKCPHCGSTATKAKPEQQFKCEGCGWKL